MPANRAGSLPAGNAGHAGENLAEAVEAVGFVDLVAGEGEGRLALAGRAAAEGEGGAVAGGLGRGFEVGVVDAEGPGEDVGRGAVALFDVDSTETLHRLMNEWGDIVPAHMEVYPLLDQDTAKKFLQTQMP